jgi:hypothetical protein
MPDRLSFDLISAHRYFSAECFNRTWNFIDKPHRTPEEDDQMLMTAFASLWHWNQRPDCTRQNLSVGYWQLARVYALLKQAGPALHYATRSLEYSQGEPPFYAGYAYEAIARAEALAGNFSQVREAIAQAHALSEEMVDAEAKQMLQADLKNIPLS